MKMVNVGGTCKLPREFSASKCKECQAIDSTSIYISVVDRYHTDLDRQYSSSEEPSCLSSVCSLVATTMLDTQDLRSMCIELLFVNSWSYFKHAFSLIANTYLKLHTGRM